MSLLWTAKSTSSGGGVETGFFGDGSDGAITTVSAIENATDDIQATTISLSVAGGTDLTLPKHPSLDRAITIRANTSISFSTTSAGNITINAGYANNGGATPGGDGGNASSYGAAGGNGGGPGGQGGAGWSPTTITPGNPLTWAEAVSLGGYGGGGGGGDGWTSTPGGAGGYSTVMASPSISFSGFDPSSQLHLETPGSIGLYSFKAAGGGGGAGNIVLVTNSWMGDTSEIEVFCKGGTHGGGGGAENGNDGVVFMFAPPGEHFSPAVTNIAALYQYDLDV